MRCVGTPNVGLSFVCRPIGRLSLARWRRNPPRKAPLQRIMDSGRWRRWFAGSWQLAGVRRWNSLDFDLGVRSHAKQRGLLVHHQSQSGSEAPALHIRTASWRAIGHICMEC
jgi:hypothetical protein